MKIIKQCGFGLWIFFLVLGITACQFGNPPVEDSMVEPLAELQSAPVVTIELAGPMKAANAEVSGAAIFDDKLILLPQYPDNYGESEQEGKIFSLPLETVRIYLEEGGGASALRPDEIVMEFNGLLDDIQGYEGFEAVAFAEGYAFFTLETKEADGMVGYVVRGDVHEQAGTVTIILDPGSMTPIVPQTNFSNMTDEAILVCDGQVITFYEANGESVNLDAVVHIFDFDLNPLGEAGMVNFPYRLTDASPGESCNSFWAINYFFPGDTHLADDGRTDPWFQGDGSPDTIIPIERIVSLSIDGAGNIQYGTQGGYELDLLENQEARNWEGLAYWESMGFLIVTDKYPGTILAFVPFGQ